jgi:hypothetical protein
MQHEIAVVGTHGFGSSIPTARSQPTTNERTEIDMETAANEFSTRTLDRMGTLSASDQRITATKGEVPFMMETPLPKTRKAARRKGPGDLDKCRYHDQMIITVGGQLMAIDEEIVRLIELMNSLPAVATNASCQGEFGQQAYASVEGPNTFAFLIAVAEAMARTFAMQGTKLMVGEQICAHNFTIEIGEAVVMRWSPHTYPLVLAAAKEVAKEMGSGGR